MLQSSVPWETRHANGLRLAVRPLEGGLIHVQAGGMDGYPPSLLDRYGIVETLHLAGGLSISDDENRQGLALPDGTALHIDRDTLAFTLTRAGEAVLQTLPGSFPATFPTVHGNRGYEWRIGMAPGERFLGFGDQYRQGFLLNGQQGSLWIRNQITYLPVPFFMSSRGYGIFFNTTRRLHFDFGATVQNQARFRVEKDYLNLYLLTGSGYDALIEQYTRLTGRPGLPPLYSFGLWLLLHERADAPQLLSVADALRRSGIPADVLSLEPGWMAQYYDASLRKAWHPDRFQDWPWGSGIGNALRSLKRRGYHIGLWLCNDYDHTWEEERQAGATALAADLTPGGESLLAEERELKEQDKHLEENAIRYDPVTRPGEPWFEHLKKFVDQGVDLFKQDGSSHVLEHPDRLYGNGRHDDEMHNLSFLLYSKQMTLGFEAHTGRRAAVLSCAGWAGVQRYPGTWTGDTGGGAQPMCAMLQEALVGHSTVTCDMDIYSPAGMHMGFLLPWAQINSWADYDYPFLQGEDLETVLRDYAHLRMRLLPLFYSLTEWATRTGRAVLRPLPLAYPNWSPAYHLIRQFEIGDALHVSVYPDSEGHLTLPAGRWWDWWTGQCVVSDGSETAMPLPPHRGGHLLLKAGALLPMLPETPQHTGEIAWDRLVWRVFPAPANASRFSLYLDDGISLDYRTGGFARSSLICRPTAKGWILEWEAIEGRQPERLARLRHDFEIVGLDKPAAVAAVSGIPLESVWDFETARLQVRDVPHGEGLHLVL